jgi:hypothetical protein
VNAWINADSYSIELVHYTSSHISPTKMWKCCSFCFTVLIGKVRWSYFNTWLYKQTQSTVGHSLLGCDTMWWCGRTPTLRGPYCLHFQGEVSGAKKHTQTQNRGHKMAIWACRKQRRMMLLSGSLRWIKGRSIVEETLRKESVEQGQINTTRRG